MKDTILLRFNNLTDLATFLKKVQPAAYVINTLQTTLSASLSAFELAIAVEEYRAMIEQQRVDVYDVEK